jgi:hypothetical protein
MKPLTLAICVAVIVALIIGTCGCTSSSNTTTPSASSSAAPSATTQPSAFLENYLAAYKAEQYSNTSQFITAWQITGVNSTSANLQWTAQDNSTGQTLNYIITYTLFPTTQDATNYINAMNLTAYSLASTIYTGGAYQNATGHAPQVYKEYVYEEGSLLSGNAQLHAIQQADNLASVTTVKEL